MPEMDDAINQALLEIAEQTAAGQPPAIDRAAFRYSADALGALIQRGLVELNRPDQAGPLLVIPSAAGWLSVGELQGPADRPSIRHPQPEGDA